MLPKHLNAVPIDLVYYFKSMALPICCLWLFISIDNYYFNKYISYQVDNRQQFFFFQYSHLLTQPPEPLILLSCWRSRDTSWTRAFAESISRLSRPAAESGKSLRSFEWPSRLRQLLPRKWLWGHRRSEENFRSEMGKTCKSSLEDLTCRIRYRSKLRGLRFSSSVDWNSSWGRGRFPGFRCIQPDWNRNQCC